MNNKTKILQWNANGVSQHKLELEKFLKLNDIDIALISETHLTTNNNFKIYGYKTYDTKRPDNKPRGGSAILVKNRIKHHQLAPISKTNLQATSIAITEGNSTLNISSIYCPPNKSITEEEFSHYFATLGTRFLAAGDYNAKSPHWGSRLTTPRGKSLLQSIYKNNLQAISGGKPTYWPTDYRKIPDIIDFGITKKIPLHYINATTLTELSSDHAPTLFTLSNHPMLDTPQDRLTNKKTNWKKYHDLMNGNLCPNIKLNTVGDIDKTIKYLNDLIAKCAKEATPTKALHNERESDYTSPTILDLLTKKRRAARDWQRHRSPNTKNLLNVATKALKIKLQEEKNYNIQEFVKGLSPTADTNYSLWKVTKKIKRPILPDPPIRTINGTWLKSDKQKAEAFAAHLRNTFTPNNHNININPPDWNVSDASNPITEKISFETVLRKIKEINPNKAPGHDMITGKLIKELPIRGKYIVKEIFNAILKLNYFPSAWKQAKIIMVPKPGKDKTQLGSYRPISLLPALSKLFERILLEKLQPYIEQNNIIPQHQFGFRNKHGTIEQVHKIANCIKTALDENKYCTGVFLDIAQAFDKVWHEGLYKKIVNLLPKKFHKLLASYIYNRKFKVAYNNFLTSEQPITAGVPQGSVLGPTLYLLYTSDLPTNNGITTTTFADDTAILYTHSNRLTATRELQNHLKEIEKWSNNWGIRINEEKSTHITFTLKKRSCGQVKLNNLTIPQVDSVKYLGMHLDKKLNWKLHLNKKKEQAKIKFKSLYWLLHKKSKLSLDSKILIYKSIIKPIWMYGIQLWGTTKKSNRLIIERTQTKIIRSILGAPRYVKNKNMLKDVDVKTAEEEAKQASIKYVERLLNHPNPTAKNILNSKKFKRLKRTDPLQLALSP